MSRRAIYYLVILGFIVLMSYIFHINIGSWYGWLIGMVLAGLGHFFVASGLEEYLFFHAADIEALKAANGKTGSKLE